MSSLPIIHVGNIPDPQATTCLRLGAALGHRWATSICDGSIPSIYSDLKALSSETEKYILEAEFVGGITAPNDPDADGSIRHTSGHGSVSTRIFPDGKASIEFYAEKSLMAILAIAANGRDYQLSLTPAGKAAAPECMSIILWWVAKFIGEPDGWLPPDLHTGLAGRVRAFRCEEAAKRAVAEAEWAVMRAAPCDIAFEEKCIISRRLKAGD